MKIKYLSILFIFLVQLFLNVPLRGQGIDVHQALKQIQGGASSAPSSSLKDERKSLNAPGGETPGFASSGGPDFMMGVNYQIHVLGQIKQPGTYRVGPSVRVAETIAMAGGLAKTGSLRHIELRQGAAKKNVDLFRYIYEGDLNANPFLQDNDVVFVPFVSQSVRIEGPVKKAGIYELADESNVWDVVSLAGGFTNGVSESGDVVVVRYDEHEKKNLIKIPNIGTELEKIPVQTGDVIVIPHIFTRDKKFDYAFSDLPGGNIFFPTYNDNVFVTGAVAQTGPQDYNPVLGIRDYVGLAGPGAKANIRRTRVLTADGRLIHNIKKYSISPGDTIVVPEKKMTTNNFLSWYNTLASTVFTGVALKSLVE